MCDEFIVNRPEAIHLATGLVVGYPPCPYTAQFKAFIETAYGLPVVAAEHPMTPCLLRSRLTNGSCARSAGQVADSRLWTFIISTARRSWSSVVSRLSARRNN
jgi:hypothetical protein